ncbi:glycosyltransferase [Verrucomicrobium spinosum]|uniref:glycosyltransferase n=1 Tax=Verrucomicrobium spinosum TaxID=2736 RepID=UPI0009462295|nr:glycosyltransferase [Verrucomicrobium spinosum]
MTLPPIPDSRWVLAVIHYDLIPLLYPEEYLGDPGWRRFYGVGLTCSKQADLLLGISQASCDEAQLHLQLPPERVVNVSSAVSSFFSQMPDDPERALVLAELEIDRSFVLYTGGDDPRKNLDGLIKAYGLMPPDVRYRHQLVVVCQVTSGTRKRLEKLQQSLGLNANDVILTGKVSDEDLRHLYSACRLFVFPSWHEGFGLPVLEAMQCGAAVLASDKSSLPEIVQLPEALFDPHDAEAMAVKMARGLEDDDFWSHLVASSVKKSQRFSWQTTAKVALEAMEQAVNRRCAFSHEGEVATQRAGQVASRRPRLAFVSPLPPDESGIASYACELLQALSRYYEIEVVSEREWCSNEWIQGNLPIRPPSWLKKHGQEYDRIVYQFGNSHFHHFMLGLLRLHPGVVALHDLYLGDMLSDLANRSAQPELLVKEAWDSHGLGVFSGATTMGDVCRDYPCSRFVFDVAPGVILHSWHARSLAENYFSGSLQGKVQVIPLNSLRRQLPSKQEARRVLNLSEDEFVCACFGIVAPSKCNDRLAEAWRLVNRVHPGAKLVFVGSDQYWPGGKGLQPVC